MKKNLFLFLTVIAFGLGLSSCLSGGSQHFAEVAIVYIDTHEAGGFTTYGKTHTGKAITSTQIKLMQPNTFKLFYYAWDEENGFTDLGEEGSLFNVQMGDEVKDIAGTRLNTYASAPEEDKGSLFEEIAAPIYSARGDWFDDFWVFQYNYKAKEDEKPSVSFFLRQNDEEEENKNLKVDIRLNITGEPKEGASEKVYSEIVAVNMEEIRHTYLSSQEGKEEISIEFYYHNEEDKDPILLKAYETSEWKMIKPKSN